MIENYTNSFGLELAKGKMKMKSFTSKFQIKSNLLLLFVLLFGWQMQSQVASYTFSQSTGTYSPITGGTSVASGSALDDGIYSVALATPFVFNNISISTIGFSANGYLIMGNITTHSYAPITNSATSSGVIAALGVDLVANAAASEMRYQQIGAEYVFQWSQFRRYLATPESLSFQIRINTTTKVISMIYDGATTIANSVDRIPQVGLRGATNSDFNARRLTTSVPDSTPSWDDTAVATTNSQNVRFTSGTTPAYPLPGLTYIFTPATVSACTTPTAQPTALTFGTTTANAIAGSFTAASPAPSKYLVVRSTTTTAPTLVNGTQFATGGNYTVVQSSAATSFSDTGLTAGTTYYYFVYSYNDGCTGAPYYLSTAPLSGSKSSACASPTVAVNILNPSGPKISWAGTGTFLLEYGASGFTPGTSSTAGTGGTLASSNANSPFTITGLSPNTAYTVYVRQSCPLGGFSANSTGVTFTTPCSPITSLPSTQNFSSFVPSCWINADNGSLLTGPATYGTSSWIADGFLNSGSTGAAKFNIYTTGSNDWLISPFYTISAGTGLVYDVAALQFASTSAPSTPWEADDFVQLLYSTDGTNWTVLKTYNSTNVPSNLGQTESISLVDLQGMTVAFAFRAVEGASAGSADIDFMVDNFIVSVLCVAPTAQPTALTFGTTTTTSISGSFAAASPAPSKYLVIRSTSATPPTPVSGTTFSSGGAYTVVQNSASLTFTTSGLTPGTQYYYYVFSYNDGCTGTPSYLSTAPLSGSKATVCSTGTALASSAVTTNSATITWTGTGDYILEYGASGFIPGTGTTAGTGGTIASIAAISPYSLTGLNPAATYTVYVRQNCPLGGLSANSSSTTFTTLCQAITTYPSLEPFNTVIPSCWSAFKGGSLATGPTTTVSTSWVADGWLNNGFTGAAKINIFSNVKNEWLISPAYTISPNVTLSYNVAALQVGTANAPTTAWEADDFVELVYSTNGTSWTNLRTYNSTNVPANIGQTEVVNLSSLTGLTVKFAFRAVEGAADGLADIDFMVDNFTLASCPAPTSPIVNAVTVTSATASWTAPSGTAPAQYNYEIRTSGTAGSGATGLSFTGNVSTTSLALSGLTAATTYTFYVRSSCGVGDNSSWTPGVTFTTLCDTYPIPYTQNFESAVLPALPSCTSTIAVTGNAWKTVSLNANGFSSKAAQYTYSTSTAANSWFFTAGLNLTAGTVYKLSYKYGNNDLSTYTEKMKVAYGTAATVGGMTIPLADHSSITGGSPFTNDVFFSPATTGVYYFGFNAYSATNQFYLYLDDISVILGPTCLAPSNVNFTGITTTSATINWTAAVGSPVSYQYEVRTGGSAGSGSAGLVASGSVNSPATTASISGLAAGSLYSVYVKSTCGGTDQSAWSAAASLATTCNLTTSLPYAESFESGTIPLCWSTQTVAGQTWAADDVNTSAPAAHTGTYFMGLDNTAAVANNSLIFSPNFDFSAVGSAQLQLNVWVYRSVDGANADAISFSINTSASLTGATILSTIAVKANQAPTVAASGWYNYMIAIPTTYNAAPFYIITKGVSVANANSRSLAFDDFRIELAPPVLTDVSPLTPICSNAAVSTPVTLTGSNLGQISSVTLNGQILAFTNSGLTSIQVALLSDSQSGTFTVTGPNGTATSSQSVNIVQSPIVEPVTGPSEVCKGATITLATESSAGTWLSSNTSVATVNGGVVTGVIAGSAVISYSLTINGCTSSQSKTIAVQPSIVSTDPANASALLNSPADFSVTASNALTYQWQISADGENFEDLTESTIFQNVAGQVAGTGIVTLNITSASEDLNDSFFRVILTGIAPCENFISAGALLRIGQTGIVSGTPASVTLCGSDIATFTVETTGTVDYWNWFVNKNLGDGPQPIDALEDGLTYDISTNGTLVVGGITPANNGWIFYIQVGSTEFESSAFSNATLTVNEPVSIASGGQPVSQLVCGGSAGSKIFAVTATGTNLSYNWQYSTTGNTGSFVDVPGTAPTGFTYGGTTTNSLTVNYAANSALGTYYYHAVISGTSGCSAVTSAVVQLQLFTPQITSEPSAATVFAGNSTNMSVTTSATAPVYQWQYSDTVNGTYNAVADNTPAGITYSGAMSSALTINTATTAVASTARFYRVLITSGGCSTASTGVQLTVQNYCTPSGTNVNTYITNFVTTGGLTNISNNSGGYNAGGYANFSNLSASQYQGQSLSFSTTATSGSGTSVWVDYNNNHVFDTATERVFTTTVYGSNPAGSFIIPLNTVPGNYRMRILHDFNIVSPTNSCAFANAIRGEAEDYTLTVVALPGCSGMPVAGTVASSASTICISGTATLTLNGYTALTSGLQFQWYSSSAGLIAGATNTTYTTPVLTSSDSYFVRVTCSNSSQFAETAPTAIIVNNPVVASTTPATRCGIGTVTLQAAASSGASLNWYAAASGGTSLSTSASFTTPSISTTTNYYVDASIGSADVHVGPFSPTAQGGVIGNQTTGWNVNFTVSAATTLKSVVVYPGTAGNAGVITVRNGSSTSGTVIATINYTTTVGGGATPQLIPINVPLTAGNYNLYTDTLPTGGLTRNTTAATYPYASSVASITGNGYDPTYYMGLYDWTFASACTSSRTLVTATVSTPPALTLSTATAAFCAGQSATVNVTSNVGAYDTYVWTPSTGITGSAATGYTFNPSVSANYTLTATQSGGSQCTNTATFNVTVNALPPAISVTPTAATVCVTDAATAIAINPVPGSASIGNGSTANTATGSTDAYPSPYGAYYENVKQQYLILASELTQAGLQAGAINSLSFNVASLGTSGIHTAYTISAKNTTVNSLTTYVTGLSTVFGPVNYQPVAGNNLHTFSTPFNWDGNSNVVIQICHTNDATGAGTNYTNNAVVNFVTTTFNSSLTYYVDNADACGSSTIILTEKQRPNLVLNGTTTQAVIWSPTTGLYTNAGATIAYTGTSVPIVYAKPAATTTYTGTLTNAAGCSRTVTSTITVNQQYPFYADTDNDGYGAGAIVQLCSTSATVIPTGYSLNNTDCAPTDNSKWQSANLFVDADADGYTTSATPTAVCYGAAIPAGYTTTSLGVDCKDDDNTKHDSFGFYVDGDGDTYGSTATALVCAVNATTAPAGYSVNNTDCNDGDADKFQSGTLYVDGDFDGYSTNATAVVCYGASVPAGYVAAATAFDCNDAVAAINPGHTEVLYNGVDDNCDGNLDEGNQLLSNVITQQCGITLAAINSVIQVTTYPNITQYRYRVYKIVSGNPVGAPQFVERAQPYFTLTQMSTYEYAATYSIQVELQRNGTWLGYYGSACQVSTPALLDNPNGSGSINPSLCGQTLATISTLIATPSLQSATAYKFRVTNITDPLAPGQVQEIERSQNYFALTMLPYYFYGTTYNVEVSVKASGVFSGYGATCPVTSPSVPMINNCDQHMAQPVNYISTASLNKVVSYRFEISLVDANDNPATTFTLDRTLPYFSFNMVPNYVQGGKYMVRVALRTTGYHSPFGEACFVYAPVSLRQDGTMKPEVLASRFDATVFPNPYVESFSLDFDSTSEDKVQLRVYDMIGKLLEERNFETTQIELAQFGQKYPSGVYNIVLTQGGNVKTLRVIKR